MRRPLKPFVTEYKGSSRRQKEGSVSTPRNEPDGDNPWATRVRPIEPSSFGQVSSADDSYEAAMRAADALFSGSQPQKAAPPPAPVPEEQPSFAEYAPRVQVTEERQVTQEQVAPTPGGSERSGRILRVIDEPPLQPFAQLEAERAPKRRGRKPGSKNKPKPGLAVVPALAADDVRPRAATPQSVPPTPYMRSAPSVPRVAVEDARSPASAPGSRTPFSWVRKRLGPGEQWKRRLPKVIW